MVALTYSCHAENGAVTVWNGSSVYADLSDCAGSFEDRVERARLICAGPEMLAAIEHAFDLWATPDDEQDSRWIDALDDAEAELYAAVDRARGRFVSDGGGHD